MKLTSTSAPASRCETSKREPGHFSVRDTNSSSAPRKPSISAAPRKSGTRKTRILAMLVSNTPSSNAGDRQFDDVDDGPDRRSPIAGVGDRQAPGREDADDQRDVEQQLEHRGEFDHREVAAGIFEDHRLVDHRQFEMGGGIVDRNAAVLRHRDDDQRDQRHAERDAQADRRRRHEGGDGGELRRAGDERER